jgi:flagellar basal-body rod protein FlgB
VRRRTAGLISFALRPVDESTLMALPLFQSTTIPVLEQVVNFSQARHGVLAGNVANLDVPGYRVRDLSPEAFQDSLKQAIERRDNAAHYHYGGYTQSDASPPGFENRYDNFRDVKDSLKSILYHDDSNVGIEHQITEITKNQAQHDLAMTILVSQFRLLQAAISERVA